MITQIGDFQFQILPDALGYNALERVRQWQWEGIPIIADDPILHFSGRTREIGFTGTYWTYQGNDDPFTAIEELADKDPPEPLGVTDDNGVFYGFWVISSLTRSEQHFRQTQTLGLNSEWNLRLMYYGDTAERGA